MTLNPLDWPGLWFLVFYVVLTGVVITWSMRLRNRIGGQPVVQSASHLSLLELAWLSGGWRRAADTVLLSFLQAGAATIGGSRKTISMNPGPVTLPSSLRTFRNDAAAATTRQGFHKAIRRQLGLVRENLEQRGLVPTRGQVLSWRMATFLLYAVPLGLGSMKVAIGLERDHPVEILVVLMIITALFAYKAVTLTPTCTQGGSAALAEAKEDQSRASRAPMAEELPLAFALTGAAVLAGTSYATFGQMIPSARAGGSGCGSDSSSSGCGGDSGGGDSGGGSGCGGCSGGGGGE